MLVKLAVGNVRKSARDYAIYFVTLTLGVTFFYAFNTVGAQVDMLPQERRMVEILAQLIFIFTWVLVVILGFLMVYANNYLVRRRAKELALYQILGMRRGHVAGILTAETLLSSLAALAAGLGLGVFLSQFLVFLTARVMEGTVTNYHFVFSADAFVLTIGAFLAIFALTLVLNLWTLRRLRLADLLQSGVKNERIPLRSLPTSLALFALSIAMIGLAYWRLLDQGYPFFSVAINDETSSVGSTWASFGVTTALVFAGTYVLFFSLGGALLHFTQASRHVYWRGLNTFTVREIASRVASSAASMATICVVIFLMLGVVTSSFGVAMTLRASLDHASPHDLTFGMSTLDERPDASLEVLDAAGITQTRTSEGPGTPATGTFVDRQARWVALHAWSKDTFDWEKGEVVANDPSMPDYIPTLADLVEATKSEPVTLAGLDVANQVSVSLDVVPVSEYNAQRALVGLEALDVPEGTYAIAANSTLTSLRELYEAVLDSHLELTVLGAKLTPMGGANVALDSSPAAVFLNSVTLENMGTLIVPDRVLAEAREYGGLSHSTTVTIDFADKPSDEEILELGDEVIPAFTNYFGVQDSDTPGFWWVSFSPTSRAELAQDMVGLTGAVTFLAVYIGLVLAMATAAILAIKMLSGAADSAPRYRRLAQLGCPRRLENQSLAAQIALFFALPLFVAAAHTVVAVREFGKVIEILVPTPITRAALIAGAFVLAIYAIYYIITYFAARHVVHGESALVRTS